MRLVGKKLYRVGPLKCFKGGGGGMPSDTSNDAARRAIAAAKAKAEAEKKAKAEAAAKKKAAELAAEKKGMKEAFLTKQEGRGPQAAMRKRQEGTLDAMAQARKDIQSGAAARRGAEAGLRAQMAGAGARPGGAAGKRALGRAAEAGVMGAGAQAAGSAAQAAQMAGREGQMMGQIRGADIGVARGDQRAAASYYTKLMGQRLAREGMKANIEAAKAGQSRCFGGETKVSTPSGQVYIKDIKVGDEVLSFDDEGQISVNVVSKVHEHEPGDIYKLSYWGGEVLITPNHWLLEAGNTFLQADMLHTDHCLVDEEGNFRPVKSFEFYEKDKTYNLTVEKDHTYIANGIRVHNGGGGKAKGGAIYKKYAKGGEYPRKQGKIEGPGTEESDSIKAKLSDGEFVVNSATVRGLGKAMGAKGKKESREKGSSFLYKLQAKYGKKEDVGRNLALGGMEAGGAMFTGAEMGKLASDIAATGALGKGMKGVGKAASAGFGAAEDIAAKEKKASEAAAAKAKQAERDEKLDYLEGQAEKQQMKEEGGPEAKGIRETKSIMKKSGGGVIHHPVKAQTEDVLKKKKAKGGVIEYNKGGWIQGAVKKPGALRAIAKKDKLIKGDEKLSASDLNKLAAKAKKNDDSLLSKRVNLAKTFAKMRKAKGGEIKVGKGVKAKRKYREAIGWEADKIFDKKAEKDYKEGHTGYKNYKGEKSVAPREMFLGGLMKSPLGKALVVGGLTAATGGLGAAVAGKAMAAGAAGAAKTAATTGALAGAQQHAANQAQEEQRQQQNKQMVAQAGMQGAQQMAGKGMGMVKDESMSGGFEKGGKVKKDHPHKKYLEDLDKFMASQFPKGKKVEVDAEKKSWKAIGDKKGSVEPVKLKKGDSKERAELLAYLDKYLPSYKDMFKVDKLSTEKLKELAEGPGRKKEIKEAKQKFHKREKPELLEVAKEKILEKKKEMDSPEFKEIRKLQKKGKQLEKDEKLKKITENLRKAKEKEKFNLEMEEAKKKIDERERPESVDVAEEKLKEKEKEFRSPEYQKMLKLEKKGKSLEEMERIEGFRKRQKKRRELKEAKKKFNVKEKPEFLDVAKEKLLEKRKKMESDPDFKEIKEAQKKGKSLEEMERIEGFRKRQKKRRELREAKKRFDERETPEGQSDKEVLERFKKEEAKFRSPEYQEMLEFEKKGKELDKKEKSKALDALIMKEENRKRKAAQDSAKQDSLIMQEENRRRKAAKENIKQVKDVKDSVDSKTKGMSTKDKWNIGLAIGKAALQARQEHLAAKEKREAANRQLMAQARMQSASQLGATGRQLMASGPGFEMGGSVKPGKKEMMKQASGAGFKKGGKLSFKEILKKRRMRY